MDFEKIDIHELLPQQEPFVMVGRLVSYDTDRTVTATIVGEDNIFAEEGRFSSAGIIENIAQTCAARIGYINKYILKKGISIGFIGAIRHLHIHRLPKTGEEIVTTIEILEEIFGMTMVRATVKSVEGPIADAEMKIAVKS